jgi:hypothetical protein
MQLFIYKSLIQTLQFTNGQKQITKNA